MARGSGGGYSGFPDRMPEECYISVDIEADGPVPGVYSMLSLGAVAVDDVSRTFYLELKPITDDFDGEALKVCGLDRETLKRSGQAPRAGMKAFADWVGEVCGTRTPVFVAYNAPFDWSFVNYYFIRYVGANPFGFSALDSKSYYMGVFGRRSWEEASKHNLDDSVRSDLPHTHNALDDAIEQADIFKKIRAKADENP